MVLAGDFNTSDRQVLYRRFAAHFTDAMRRSWAGPTSAKESLLWRAMLLRIDHLFIAPALCADGAKRLPLPGSDHHAITARLGPCPG